MALVECALEADLSCTLSFVVCGSGRGAGSICILTMDAGQASTANDGASAAQYGAIINNQSTTSATTPTVSNTCIAAKNVVK